MSERYPGGLIRKTPPTVTGPTDGEGGSAPGIWTLEEVAYYEKEGGWPKPVLPRELYGWGDNGDGVLGINVDETSDRSSPVQVGALTTWDQVSSGDDHSVAIKTDGTLWAWGYNFYGSLGDGTVISRSSPVQIGSLTTWSQALSANEFTIAVKTDGTLWSWGNNSQGRLGLNDDEPRSSPTQIGSDTNWYKIGTGYNSTHTLAIKTDGTLWSWGNGTFGRLGKNSLISRSSPVQIGSLTTWSEISAGDATSAAIKTDGTLWMWGRNGYGAVGNGTNADVSSPVQVGALTNWQKVTVGSSVHAIKTTGTLWGWGYNVDGQLGDNTNILRSSPVQIGSLTTWAEATWSGGAIKTDGTLWTWGLNNRGQLGENTQGALTYRSSPVQIGSETNWSKITQGTYMFMAVTKG